MDLSESKEESESDEVNRDMSCKRLLQILTFLFPCCWAVDDPNRVFMRDLMSVNSGSPIELRKMLCKGVMHGVNYGSILGVTDLSKNAGDLLPFLSDRFLADLLRDLDALPDLVDFLTIFFPLELLLLLLGCCPFFLFREIDLFLDLGTCVLFLLTTLNRVLTSDSHFFASSRARLKALVLRLLLRTPLLLFDFDLETLRDFLDLEREGFLIKGPKEPLLTSLKPLVCLNMLRLTLLIFFLDLDRPLELAPDVADLPPTESPDLPDRADFTDLERDRLRFKDFDLDLFLSFLVVLLLRFLPFDFFNFLPELLLRALFGVDLRDFLLEPLLGLLRLRAEIGQLLLPDRDLARRVYSISFNIPCIRIFLRFFSVASIISVAMFSRLFENSSTRLLNWETPWPRCFIDLFKL